MDAEVAVGTVQFEGLRYLKLGSILGQSAGLANASARPPTASDTSLRSFWVLFIFMSLKVSALDETLLTAESFATRRNLDEYWGIEPATEGRPRMLRLNG